MAANSEASSFGDVRDQHRRGRHLVGDPQRVEREAEQVVGAGAPRSSSCGSIESTLTAKPSPFERTHASPRCGTASRQAAEVDHVGAVAQRAGAPTIARRTGARIDDLREDRHLVRRSGRPAWRRGRRSAAGPSVLRPALHRDAVGADSASRSVTAAARHDDGGSATGTGSSTRRRIMSAVISAATRRPISRTSWL